MARYNRKRTRELQHDVFRDKTMSAFDRLSNRLEGQGRTILYAVGGLLALVLLASLYSWYSGRKAEEARRALGHAIEIAAAPVSETPAPNATGPAFTSERERAQHAVEEFQKVADKYQSDPYHALAQYFHAANLLTVDRPRGIGELETVSKGSNDEIAARAKFALALAREEDGQYDKAATLYNDLVKAKTTAVPADVANVHLAAIYEKQGKKKEATDLFYSIVEAARTAKDKDSKPVQQSAAARTAAEKLEKLDPARFAQLPPEPAKDLPF